METGANSAATLKLKKEVWVWQRCERNADNKARQTNWIQTKDQKRVWVSYKPPPDRSTVTRRSLELRGTAGR